jgi:hypothetical protein
MDPFQQEWFAMGYQFVLPGLLALAVAVPLQGQGSAPFGVPMGSPISNYKSCEKAEQVGWYTCKTLPRSHAAFELYIIQAHPRHGVCFVKALGKDINRDARGVRTRAEIEKLAGQIAQTYGPHTRIRDTLSSRSDLKGVDEWMQAVEEDERTFSYDWIRGPYPNDLDSIHLFASATDGETGYAVAEFYYKNNTLCDDELDKEAF